MRNRSEFHYLNLKKVFTPPKKPTASIIFNGETLKLFPSNTNERGIPVITPIQDCIGSPS